MQTELTHNPDNRCQLSVTLSNAQWLRYQDEALKELAKKFSRKGFRQGSMSKQQLKKLVNETSLLHKAAEKAIQETFNQALRKHALLPITPPKISVNKESLEEPLSYTVEFITKPQVRLDNYTGLGLERKKVEVSEKEIADTLKEIQRSRAKLITVSRAAQQGDRVEIDFSFKQGAVVIEGTASRNHPVVIGEKRLLPDMEKALIGMKASQAKSISLKLPKDFPLAHVAGKTVTAEITMRLVQAVVLPQLDDEFSQSLGSFKNLTQLKQNIKQGLAMEKEQAEQKKLDQTILEELIKKAKFDLPQELIEEEAQRLFTQFQKDVTQYGLSFDEYKTKVKATDQDFLKNFRSIAEKRLRAEFILDYIGNQQQIAVDEQEVEKAMQEYLKRFRSPQEARQHIDPERLAEYTRKYLRDQKIMTFLRQSNVS